MASPVEIGISAKLPTYLCINLMKHIGRGAARGRGGRRGRPAGTTAKVMAARRYVPHHSTRRLRYTRLKPVGRESFIRYKIDVVLLT